jgi:hypothetical protein
VGSVETAGLVTVSYRRAKRVGAAARPANAIDEAFDARPVRAHAPLPGSGGIAVSPTDPSARGAPIGSVRDRERTVAGPLAHRNPEGG